MDYQYAHQHYYLMPQIKSYKKLAKKDYDSLSEIQQNEFNDLSELIVTVRDGKLGE